MIVVTVSRARGVESGSGLRPTPLSAPRKKADNLNCMDVSGALNTGLPVVLTVSVQIQRTALDSGSPFPPHTQKIGHALASARRAIENAPSLDESP
jgi:hypothetical protein